MRVTQSRPSASKQLPHDSHVRKAMPDKRRSGLECRLHRCVVRHLVGVAVCGDGGLGSKEFLGRCRHLAVRHTVDDLGKVSRRAVPARQQHLGPDVLHHRGRILALPIELALEHGLRLRELLLRHAGETLQAREDGTCHLARVGWLANAVDAEEAAVRVRRGERRTGLDTRALLQHLPGKPGRHSGARGGGDRAATPEDGLQERDRGKLLLPPGGRLEADCEVAEGRRTLKAQITAGVRGLGLGARLHGDGVVVRKGAHGPLAELRVLDVHADEDHALRGEMVQHVAPHGLRGEVGHRAVAGQRAVTERVVAVGGLVQELADRSVGILAESLRGLLDLLVRGLDLPWHEAGEEDVPDHQRDDQRHHLAEHLDLVHGLFAAGLAHARGVCPELLEGLDGAQVAEVGGGVVAHHRDHVRDAKVGGVLEAAPGIHEEAKLGHEPLLVHRGDLQAVLQLRELRLRCDQLGLRRVEQDRAVHRAALVRVRHGLLDLVEVVGRQLCHHLPDILLLKLHNREALSRQGRRRSRCRRGRRRLGRGLGGLEPRLHLPHHPWHAEHLRAARGGEEDFGRGQRRSRAP
mmetsp:Transcript_88139/g.234015  ORF Transcript_88139/g.234015 Transcript_88139/m.234015 type:complete len:577 (-) Transcript_88139:7-1737(-)